MIRLTPDLGNFFYVLLRYLQAGDIQNDLIFEWVRQRMEMGGSDPIYREVLDGIFPNPSQNPAEIANVIGAALASDDDHADGELISELVTVLKNPQARTVLSGRVLDRLRRSILVPDELAEVRRSLFHREMSCTACGHGFEPGEIATVFAESVDSSAQQTLVCTRCIPPVTVACSTPKCHGKTRLHDKMIQAFHGKLSTKCEPCKAAEKSGITPDLTIPPPVLDDDGMLRPGDLRWNEPPLDGPVRIMSDPPRRNRPEPTPWRPATHRFGAGQPPMTEGQRLMREAERADALRMRRQMEEMNHPPERLRFNGDPE